MQQKDKRSTNIFVLLIIIGGTIMGVACKPGVTPRPRGYYRIDFPEKTYQLSQITAPFNFEYPVYTQLKIAGGTNWFNIVAPEYGATIYLTYKPIENNLEKHIEDVRGIAYKHIVKANDIGETILRNDSHRAYGILYDISGNTASAVNFFVTDSIHHFISGSLYFNAPPNRDSLQPAIHFFRSDIIHLMETIKWN